MGVIVRQPVHHVKDEEQKREENKEKPANFGVTKGLFLSRQQEGPSDRAEWVVEDICFTQYITGKKI